MEGKLAGESESQMVHWMGLLDANAAGNVHGGTVMNTNPAYLTMVALDNEGRPTPVPPLIAETPDQQRRMREAELRRANRLAEREEILTHREGRPG